MKVPTLHGTSRPKRLLRRHFLFAAVLSVAAALRIAATVAYWPGILWPDSWGYLWQAYAGNPVAFAPPHPSGYPLLIRIITLAGRQIAVVMVAQHVAGLAVGAVGYLLLLRMGTPRWLAALASAVVLLDGYAIGLEQHLMSEPFFGLCLALAAFAILRSFALAVIRDQPGDYLDAVASDSLRYVQLGSRSDGLVLPGRDARQSGGAYARMVARRYLPRQPPLRARFPAQPLASYVAKVHTSPPVLALHDLVGALRSLSRTPARRQGFAPT